ncbi:MAG: glucose-1-phosphate adenylyltransferase [Acidobacteria bacterium]|jgi:glucose-1-phosphate adenylyltransferase|nr:glucose-1-phosphate adenylyltransferase [Acidobacteriota bacterium]
MKNVLAIILGGGRGTRLYPLTKFRAKPAVPIGGKFRLIDIPISNCLHWDIKKIMVLTQFNTASLHRHISQTYKFDGFSEGFLQILAAQQTIEDSNWYQGTADAVRKNIHYIKNQKVDHVVVLSGDQLYRIHLRDFMATHLENKADVTIAVKPVRREQAGEFGILQIDDRRRIVRFVEKPKEKHQLDELFTPASYLEIPDQDLNFIASMGIYIFKRDVLIDLLEHNVKEDFGREVIPEAIHDQRVFAYVFNDYWEDIGTIKAFFEANLDFANPIPRFDFYNEEAPIYTRKRFLPGSKIENCDVHYSLISEGSIIEGSKLTNTVIGIRSIIRSSTYLERVVMMGADYYQGVAEKAEETIQSRCPVGIGRNCIIRNAILDKNVRIGEGARLLNEKGLTNFTHERYSIVDGITVVPKDMEIPAGFVI